MRENALGVEGNCPRGNVRGENVQGKCPTLDEPYLVSRDAAARNRRGRTLIIREQWTHVRTRRKSTIAIITCCSSIAHRRRRAAANAACTGHHAAIAYIPAFSKDVFYCWMWAAELARNARERSGIWDSVNDQWGARSLNC